MEITSLQLRDALLEFFRSNSATLSEEDKDAFEQPVLLEQDMITLASFLARRIREVKDEEFMSPMRWALMNLRTALQEVEANNAVSLVKTFTLIAELMALPGAKNKPLPDSVAQELQNWIKQ